MNTSFLAVFKGGKATTQSLVDAIVQAVDDGLLTEGDKMPSTRELSTMVGASRTIVVRAFDQLIARGYLKAVAGSSTIVAPTERISKDILSNGESLPLPPFPWSGFYSPTAQSLQTNLDDLITSADMEQLQSGAVPIELLPAKEWGRLVSTAFQKQLKPQHSAKECFGYEPLRAAIAGFLRRTHGVVCQPDQVVLYSGAQSALANIADLMVIAGQTAVVEDPGYVGAREQFRVHGANVVPVPVDKDGLITESLLELKQPVHWIHLSPSGQDPTGAILSQPRRKQLLKWCEANKTAIIEDAWDSEFHYGSDFPAPLFSGGRGIIFLYNFWRLLFPLSAMGVLVLPEDLIPLFRSSKYLNDRQFTTVEHYMLSELIGSGKLEQHRRNLWKVFRKRRQALIFELKSAFVDDVDIPAPSAGMHTIVRFNQQWTAQRIMKTAAEAGLPLASTAPYYCQHPVQNEFMMHFASVSPEDAKSVINKFASLLHGLE